MTAAAVAFRAPASGIPQPDSTDQLLVRSFLHQSLVAPPQPPTRPPEPQSRRAPSGARMALRIGGHRPHPSRCRRFDSVRGSGQVVALLEDPEDVLENTPAMIQQVPPAWSDNVNTLWNPLDTLTGLQYASVIAARNRQRTRREEADVATAAADADAAIGEQLRGFARFFSLQPTAGLEAGYGRNDVAQPRSEPPVRVGMATPATPCRRPRTATPMLQQLRTPCTPGGSLRPTTSATSRGRIGRYSNDSRRRWDQRLEQRQLEAMQELRELAVLSLLCQVLRTDDPAEVHSWLTVATEREKALVAGVIGPALDSWWRRQQQPQQQHLSIPQGSLAESQQQQPQQQHLSIPQGSLAESQQQHQPGSRVDRLVIDHSSCNEEIITNCQQWASPAAASSSPADNAENRRNTVARPRPVLPLAINAGGVSEIWTRQAPAAAPTSLPLPQPDSASCRLRYSRVDPSFSTDSRTGHAWRLQTPGETWDRLA